MIRKSCLAAMALAALANMSACSDNSEVFYSISYPVVRVEAEVEISAPETEEPSTGEDTQPEPGTGTDGSETTEPATGTDGSGTDGSEATEPATGTDGSGTGSGEGEGEEPAVDPLVAQIEAEVTAEAPVQAGGRYDLDFTQYNCGPLYIRTAAESEQVRGAFVKEPGASQITLLSPIGDWNVTLSSYTDTDGVRKVMLAVDLTEDFQQRYPEAGLTKVSRREYTSTPY